MAIFNATIDSHSSFAVSASASSPNTTVPFRAATSPTTTTTTTSGVIETGADLSFGYLDDDLSTRRRAAGALFVAAPTAGVLIGAPEENRRSAQQRHVFDRRRGAAHSTRQREGVVGAVPAAARAARRSLTRGFFPSIRLRKLGICVGVFALHQIRVFVARIRMLLLLLLLLWLLLGQSRWTCEKGRER